MTILPIRDDLSLPLDEIELRTSRSSGPGGQHANVTASRVEAVFDVQASETLSEAQKARICARLGPRVTAAAQDTRSQHRNRDLALDAARSTASPRRSRSGARAPRRARPAPSQRRRVDAKKRRGDIKRGRRRPDTD